MKHYELTYLISPDLSETELKSLQEKIKSSIENKGGVFFNADEPTKKKLAYPIKKQFEAYLMSLSFQLSPDKLAEFEQELKKEDKIFRFIIITKKLPSPAQVLRGKILAGKKVPEVTIKTKKIVKPKKVELKEIEKKLEEILNTD